MNLWRLQVFLKWFLVRAFWRGSIWSLFWKGRFLAEYFRSPSWEKVKGPIQRTLQIIGLRILDSLFCKGSPMLSVSTWNFKGQTEEPCWMFVRIFCFFMDKSRKNSLNCPRNIFWKKTCFLVPGGNLLCTNGLLAKIMAPTTSHTAQYRYCVHMDELVQTWDM